MSERADRLRKILPQLKCEKAKALMAKAIENEEAENNA